MIPVLMPIFEVTSPLVSQREVRFSRPRSNPEGVNPRENASTSCYTTLRDCGIRRRRVKRSFDPAISTAGSRCTTLLDRDEFSRSPASFLRTKTQELVFSTLCSHIFNLPASIKLRKNNVLVFYADYLFGCFTRGTIDSIATQPYKPSEILRVSSKNEALYVPRTDVRVSKDVRPI